MKKLVHLLITTESFFKNLPIKKSCRSRILNSASCHAEFPGCSTSFIVRQKKYMYVERCCTVGFGFRTIKKHSQLKDDYQLLC